MCVSLTLCLSENYFVGEGNSLKLLPEGCKSKSVRQAGKSEPLLI